MSSININMEEVKQRLNKRKNTEEHVCVLFETEIKRNRHTSWLKLKYGQCFLSNEESWTNKLNNLKSFIDLNGRRPNKSEETEKVLGTWLSTQLNSRKTKKNIMSNEDIRYYTEQYSKSNSIKLNKIKSNRIDLK